ncbi:TNR6 factor, partial [Zapornia atra]|nr:TNR6 factor [Zapornia atra]
TGHVKTISCPTDISKHCVLCENGKEYMDHENDADECNRCNSCDNMLGFESTKNCTPEQNTECGCAKNHFCISELCAHCSPCTICESGVIKKPCTSTSDTVCGTKGNVFILLYKVGGLQNLSLLISLLHLFSGERTPHICRWQKNPVRFKCQEHSFSFMLLDVDLSNHIAGIVEEMTLQEVRTFVRYHRLPEPIIDQTVRDYPTDTSEQKIKLFQVWYQRHGIKGAYGSLINSLREFKMCAAADKIEEKLKATVASYQEGGQSHSDDTEQSQTCTQESRNSYKGSPELNKTYSDSSEE